MAEIDIILPELDDIAADFRDAWQVRGESANPPRVIDVSEGTLPHKVSLAVATTTLPLYYNHNTIARSFVVRGMTGDRLERYARERLLANDDGTIRLPATGGSGYFEATKIAAGGALILQGTVLLHRASSTRYQVVVSATYYDGDPIPIQGISTGASTNLDADEPLVFDSPPAGLSQGGGVLAQNDGTGVLVGLTGGREAETDPELQDRVIEAQSEPPAAGNSAEIVQAAQKTGGVPVQKAFAVPAWFGPGATSVPFILRPDASITRIPNSTQIGLVEAQLRASFPTDYSITVPIVLPQNFTVAIGVTWLNAARGFSDLVPWPEYIPGDPVVVDAGVTPSSLALRATTGTDTTAPQVGQNVALYDLTARRFRRKRIATVTEVVANRSWDLTFSTSLGVSEAFTPTENALISPFSSSMQRLVAPIVDYARTLGPGEQFASLPDPGGRRRRWPYSPDAWPSSVTNEGLVNAAKLGGAISDSEVLLPAVPFATTVGTPGAVVYLLQLADLGIFKQT